jgi:hypothetical protein
MIVFLACLGVLGGVIVLPALRRAKCGCQKINCSNNIRQIGLSFRQWALDNNDTLQMQVPTSQGGTMEFVNDGRAWVHFIVMSNELNTPKVLFCPQDKGKGRIEAKTFGTTSYPLIPFTDDNNLSYFVGVDAVQTNATMLLAGDRNLTNRIKQARGLVEFPTNRPAGWTREMHDQSGNVCLIDGSAQQTTTSRLRRLLVETGVAINRLAMP